MLFEFSHTNLEFKGIETWCKPESWKISDLKKALRDSQNATADNGWYPAFFENHDRPRCVNHYFDETADKKMAAKTMGTLLMTLRGTPFLYQGQELGLENVAWPSIDCYNDISSFGQYEFALSEGFTEEQALACVHEFSRDSARTPMQWDDTLNAGFTSGTPWLPVHEDYREVNVMQQEQDETSVLSWFRTLAKLRAEYPVLAEGSYEEILADHEQIIAYIRKNDEDELCVLINLSNETAAYDPSLCEGKEVILNNAETYEKGSLAPLQCVILR